MQSAQQQAAQGESAELRTAHLRGSGGSATISDNIGGSSFMTHSVASEAVNPTTCDLLSAALTTAMLQCNAQLSQLGGTAEQQGTTALLCVVERKAVVLANSGDSRAVLCRDGEAVQLTDDHKVRGIEIDDAERSR